MIERLTRKERRALRQAAYQRQQVETMSFDQVHAAIRDGKALPWLRENGATWTMLLRVGFKPEELIAIGAKEKKIKKMIKDAARHNRKRLERKEDERALRKANSL